MAPITVPFQTDGTATVRANEAARIVLSPAKSDSCTRWLAHLSSILLTG